MTQQELNIPKLQDLKVIPKDETLDAVVIDLDVQTWEQLTKDNEKKKNLRDPDGKVLIVKYDAAGFIRSDNFPFTENPTNTSRYGRFIEKYGDFKVGQKIKVLFDEDGKSDILLPKK